MFLLQRKTPTTEFVDVYFGPSTTFADYGLTPESTYIYRARVEGEHGIGPWSNEVSVFTRDAAPVHIIRFRQFNAATPKLQSIVKGA